MLQQVMVDKEKELWEAVWQPAAEGVYPTPVITASSITAVAAAAQPQPERKLSEKSALNAVKLLRLV